MRRMRIYAITDIMTGEQYIGASRDIETRWYTHRAALAGGYHDNPLLQVAWNRDGAAAFTFTLLDEVTDYRELSSREDARLRERWACKGSLGFNRVTYGGTGLPGRMPTDTRQKAFRLTDEAQALLRILAQRRGITETAVVEQLIRDEAERRGIAASPQA